MIKASGGWPEVALGDICELKYGKSLPESYRAGGEVPVYGSNGVVGRHDKAITVGPTIVVGRKGSYGEVNYSPVGCWPIDTAYYIDQTATAVHLGWLRHALLSLGLNRMNRAAAIPGLNREDAYRARLILPVLAEQRRIAEILDLAQTLQTKRRQMIANLDQLAQAVFVDMFGDPLADGGTAIGDFVRGFESGKSLAAEDKDDVSSPYRVLKVSAVTSLTYRPNESKPLPADYVPPPAHLVRNGDLLFSRANTPELIGATAYVDETPSNMALSDKLWRFVWHEERRAAPHFVAYLFRQPKFRAEIRRRATGTSGSMKNISQEKVLSIKVCLPSLAAQLRFEDAIQCLEKLKAVHRGMLANSADLYAALQQRAFLGEL